MAKQWQKSDGFSLIEMLVVMLIVLIILHMVSYPSFDRKKADVQEVNDELIAVLTYYQTLAAVHKTAVVIKFPPGSSEVLIHSSTLGINTSYPIRNGYIHTGNSVNAKEIIFAGDHINHGATVNYFINNERYELIFQLVKGRIRIEKG